MSSSVSGSSMAEHRCSRALAFACLALVVGFGGHALLRGKGATGAERRARMGQGANRSTTAVTLQRLEAAYAAFRVRRGVDDQLARGAAADVTRFRTSGAEPRLARRGAVMGGRDPLYLVPARQGLCLYEGSSGGGCTKDLAQPRLVGLLICDHLLDPDNYRIVGLMPDSVTRVRISLAGGGAVVPQYGRNVFWLEADRRRPGALPSEVVWTYPDEAVTVQLHVPPDAAKSRCRSLRSRDAWR